MSQAKNNPAAERLADFIEANPKIKFDIDNDVWYLMKSSEDAENEDEDQLATSKDFDFKTKWYSQSNLYGAGLAEAMVILLNRRGFKIEASAV